MAQRLPILKVEQLIRALERDGWFEVKGKGGHRQFKHPTKPGKVTVPIHRRRDIEPWLLRKILNRVGISPDEFVRLL